MSKDKKIILGVVAFLVVLLIVLLVGAGSCSGHGGGAGAAAPVRSAQSETVSSVAAQPSPSVQEAVSSQESTTIDGLNPEDMPSNVAMSLVFDVSGSMDDSSGMSGTTKLESAKRQSKDFVSSVSGEQDDAAGGLSVKVGVASFATSAEENCPMSNDASAINASIDALDAYGQTNMYEGLRVGIDQLLGEDGSRLMVYLSDGLSNCGGSSSDILQLAKEAADEGIKIYTIGFGSSSDIDEKLLRKIAKITGGVYSHEDSSNISSAAVGLFATMMQARLQEDSDVLLSKIGSVKQGATVNAGTFDVTKNGTVQVYLYWPGSILDLHLTDPDGVTAGDDYPNYTIDTSSIPTLVTIDNAKQGTWSVDVFGKEVSMTNEPYYAAVAFNEMLAQGGAGAAPNNGEGLIFIVLVVAVACIVGVFAFTKRRSSQ